MLPYLAAAGIGRIGIIDDDTVSVSNLQRQVIYARDDAGKSKAALAAQRLKALNPDCQIDVIEQRLSPANADALVRGYAVAADGSDNIEARLALHDACFRAGIPLVSGAAQGMDGQLTTYFAYQGAPHPCLRCLSGGADPQGDDLPSCAQAGVLGPLVGVMGTLQAVEVIRVIAGIGAPRSGKLTLFDAATLEVEVMGFKRLQACDQNCRYLPEI